MTDREMLELAAKAARVVLDGEWSDTDRMSVSAGGWWNPLTDDGDALRLAVKLGITFRHFGHKVSAVGTTQCDEYVVGDPCEATRRAIVRAAAETRRQRC